MDRVGWKLRNGRFETWPGRGCHAQGSGTRGVSPAATATARLGGLALWLSLALSGERGGVLAAIKRSSGDCRGAIPRANAVAALRLMSKAGSNRPIGRCQK